MKRFSERYGYKKAREMIQVENLDEVTRERLWNVISVPLPIRDQQGYPHRSMKLSLIYENIWRDVFQIADFRWPRYDSVARKELFEMFSTAAFHELFDIVEYMYGALYHHDKEALAAQIQTILEEELVGYRLIDGQFVPITEPEQLDAIDAALQNPDVTFGAKNHINLALNTLRGGKPEDVIREAIHAVESEARVISGMETESLSRAIEKVVRERGLNEDIGKAFKHLYQWTSSEPGVRHSDDGSGSKLTQTDAIFMVVACSAMVSWLRRNTK